MDEQRLHRAGKVGRDNDAVQGGPEEAERLRVAGRQPNLRAMSVSSGATAAAPEGAMVTAVERTRPSFAPPG
jgi:hypothetical protein